MRETSKISALRLIIINGFIAAFFLVIYILPVFAAENGWYPYMGSKTNQGTAAPATAPTSTSQTQAQKSSTDLPSSIEVEVHYDPRETTILRYDNYPELSLLTFVAIETDKDGKKKLYDGRYGPIEILMKNESPETADEEFMEYVKYCLDQYPLFQFYNLGTNNINAIEWKNTFYAIGHAGVNTMDHLPTHQTFSELEETISVADNVKPGQSGNPTLVVIRDWNFKETVSNLAFAFSVQNKLVDPSTGKEVNVTIKPFGHSIKLDVDNIDFVRENVYKDGGVTEHWSKYSFGRNYVGDPGPFVVDLGDETIIKDPNNPNKGHGYTYEKIYDILVDAEKRDAGEKGLPWPMKGGSVDWIQVAAAKECNEYNASNHFYKLAADCVWEVFADERKTRGSVDEATGWRIHLNPFLEIMRFNLEYTDKYGFTFFHILQYCIRHEMVHCYQDLRGYEVFDNDDDTLYVGTNNYGEPSMNPYFRFAFDHKERGFMEPDPEKKGLVVSWLNGSYGDKRLPPKKTFNDYFGRFVSFINIDSDILDNVFGAIEGIPPTGSENLFPTTIPNDIPIDKFIPEIQAVFLYNPLDGTECSLGDGCWITFKGIFTEGGDGKKYGPCRNGYYKPATYLFELGPCENGSITPEEIKQLVEQGYTKLAILYTGRYDYGTLPDFKFYTLSRYETVSSKHCFWNHPCELDACFDAMFYSS